MTKPDLLKTYSKCFLIRACENKIQSEYSSDLIKTPVHLCNGAESIAVLANQAWGHELSIFGTYRNHHWFLSQTDDIDLFFLELLGRDNDISGGRAGSMHLSHPQKGVILTSAVVSSTLPIAAGWAYASKMKGSQKPTIVFFGDGAIEEGVFWETLNFCNLKKLNIKFICEDNELAIHVHKKSRQSFDIKGLTAAFSIPFYESNAWDFEKVFSNYLNTQPGPEFFYVKYSRLLEHVGILDDSQKDYRNPVSIPNIDPLEKLKSELLKNSELKKTIEDIENKIHQRISDSYQKALRAPLAPISSVQNHVFEGSNV